jgi:hypothetical protein
MAPLGALHRLVVAPAVDVDVFAATGTNIENAQA